MAQSQATISDLFRIFGCTAVIRPFRYDDDDTGEKVSMLISPQYSILTVGTREYYFRRDNGVLEGTAIVTGDS